MPYFVFRCDPNLLSVQFFTWFFFHMVLSINPSTVVFVSGNFNLHHKGWSSYASGTVRSLGLRYMWVKVFKNGPSKICGRQSLGRPYRSIFLKGCLPQIYLVHSWILWPMFSISNGLTQTFQLTAMFFWIHF